MHKVISSILLASVLFVLAACSDDSSTNTDTDPAEYINADAIKGGILYDKFWSIEAGYDQNSPNITKFNAFSDFFRCKQCHGWDLMGKEGSYINRAPKTNRPNIAKSLISIKQKYPKEIFDMIKKGTKTRRQIAADLSTYDPATNATVGDQMPDFSQILTDAQIWDLVKFIKEGALDVTQLYDATYTGTYPTGKAIFTNIGKSGDAAKGETFYKEKCQICHGVDGTQIKMENMSVGQFTRTKPNEVQHKVKFGQLGSPMKPTTITIDEMKNLYKALADTVKFPN